MTLITLLLGSALAQDVPAKPEPRDPIEGQCTEALPLTEPCRGVLLPTTEAADLLDIEVWADEVAAHYSTDLAAAVRREDLLRDEVKKLQTAQWVRAAEGVLVGLSVGVLTYTVVDRLGDR